MACGDYNYSSVAIDFIESIIAQLRSAGTIIAATDNSDGTYEVEVSGLLGLAVGNYVTIAGTDYRVQAIDSGVPSFTIEIGSAPTGTFTRPEPFFFHGSPIRIQQQVGARSDINHKYPAIWAFEPFEETNNIDRTQQVGTTFKVKMLFVREGNPTDWTEDQHHDSLASMRTYVQDFIRLVRQDSRVVREMFTEYRIEEHINFGVVITDRGNTSLIIAQDVNGIMLECDIPLNKRFCNCAGTSSGGSAPSCAPALVLRDGVFYATVASGGTVDVPSTGGSCNDATWTLENTDGTELDSGIIGSGDSATIVAPDATITVNSTAFDSFPAGVTTEIWLTDENDGSIEIWGVGGTLPGTPQIYVGNTQLNANGSLVNSIIAGSSTPYALNIHDSAGADVGTITDPNTIEVADATVTVNSVAFDTVVAEGTIDVPVVRLSDEVTPVGSIQGSNWVIDTAAVTLENTQGTQLSVTSVEPETATTIVAPDSTFSINGTQVATIPSGDSDSIEVRKETGSDQIGSLQGQYWRISDSVITLEDTASNTLSTTNVPATETATITAPDGTVNVNKSDTTLISSVTVLSGGTNAYNVADSTGVLKDTAGTIISTTSIKATESQDITAPDGTVNVNKSDSTLISAQTVLSNGTTNYNVADSTAVLKDTAGVTLSTTSIKATESEDITAPDADVENSDASYTATIESGGTLVVPDSDVNVNSNLEGTVVSIKTIDINLTDGVSAVTPIAVSVTGNTIDITVSGAAAPVGATLMKTGQTTSYRTGDDGDLEDGRATDITTLASNNPFGNTDRFTDELGGTAYTNDIVIDWSTYDGSTVLGWRRTTNGTGISWNNAIDGALLVSIGTFTSGWKLPNFNEMASLFNASKNMFGSTGPSPWTSVISSGSLWTSTTSYSSTATALRLNTATGELDRSSKTNSSQHFYMPCRIFTVTGTTLS
jgi:hypothetical protein